MSAGVASPDLEGGEEAAGDGARGADAEEGRSGQHRHTADRQRTALIASQSWAWYRMTASKRRLKHQTVEIRVIVVIAPKISFTKDCS